MGFLIFSAVAVIKMSMRSLVVGDRKSGGRGGGPTLPGKKEFRRTSHFPCNVLMSCMCGRPILAFLFSVFLIASFRLALSVQAKGCSQYFYCTCRMALRQHLGNPLHLFVRS